MRIFTTVLQRFDFLAPCRLLKSISALHRACVFDASNTSARWLADMEVDQPAEGAQPAKVDEAEAFSIRWPQYIRKQMVRALLAGLHMYSEEKYGNKQVSGAWTGTEWLMSPGHSWPNSKIMRPIWQALIKDVKQKLADPPTDRAIREAALRWTRAFLLNGSVKDKPPHLPGERLETNRENLVKIKDILMEGYLDKQGNTAIYKSLAEAHKKSAAFRAAFADLKGLTSFQGLWCQLKQMFPKLNTVQIKLKKARDHQLVQVCSDTSYTSRVVFIDHMLGGLQHVSTCCSTSYTNSIMVMDHMLSHCTAICSMGALPFAA
ncbi:hypothetical protein [Limnohabitans sp.]